MRCRGSGKNGFVLQNASSKRSAGRIPAEYVNPAAIYDLCHSRWRRMSLTCRHLFSFFRLSLVKTVSNGNGGEFCKSIHQPEVVGIECFTMLVGDNPDRPPHFTCLPWHEDAVSDGIGFDAQIIIVGLANAIKLHSATIQSRPTRTEETRRCSA